MKLFSRALIFCGFVFAASLSACTLFTSDSRQDVNQLREAAEQGDVGAQYNLGVRYYKGEGVEHPSSDGYGVTLFLS